MSWRYAADVGLLLVPAVGGVLLVLVATRGGVGVSPDSVAYINSARQLADGNGLTVTYGLAEPERVTWWPPLFPALLAGISKIGPGPLGAARWLNALTFGSTILLLGLIVKHCTGSLGLALCGGVLLATSKVMLWIHSMAWSEPGFLFFGIAGLFLVAVYARSLRRSVLVIAAGALALSWLYRYAGAAWLAAGVVSLLLGDGRSRDRILRAAGLGAMTSLPMALWMVRNISIEAPASSRRLAWHPAFAEFFRSASEKISNWILPDRLLGTTGDLVFLFLTACILAGLIVHARRATAINQVDRAGLRANICWVFGLFLAVYPAFLIAARSVFDRNIPFDDRILSPLMVAGLLLVLLGSYSIWQMLPRRHVITLLALVCCCGLLLHRTRSVIRRSTRIAHAGLGYHHKDWRVSPTIAALKALAPTVLLYSNAPDAIYILTGRQALWLPRKIYLPLTSQNASMLELQRELNRGALIVCLERVGRSRWTWMPTAADVEECFPVKPIIKTNDGAIYALDRTDG